MTLTSGHIPMTLWAQYGGKFYRGMRQCVPKHFFNFHSMSSFRVKANNSNIKVDLFVNGDLIDPNEDRKLVSQLGIQDKTVC
jgi:hypothetical protein